MAKPPSKSKPDTRQERVNTAMAGVGRAFGNNPPTTARDTVKPSSSTRVKPSGGGVKVTHTIKFKGK